MVWYGGAEDVPLNVEKGPPFTKSDPSAGAREHGLRPKRTARRPLDPLLAMVDQFTRECLVLLFDVSLTGQKVALALSKCVPVRGTQISITIDNVTEASEEQGDGRIRISGRSSIGLYPVRRLD